MPTDNNTGGNPLPFNQNINIAQAVAVGASLLVVLTGGKVNLDLQTQAYIVMAITGVAGFVTWILHTFVNHPANVEKAHAFARAAVVAARRTAPGLALVLALIVMAGTLSACTGPDPFFSNPQNDLNLAKAGVGAIEALYVSACNAGALQNICSDEDQAKAAQLEKSITDAISTAQLLVNIYNGVAAPSGVHPAPSLVDVENAIAGISKAVQDFTDFVDQLQAKKLATLTARMAKPQISGSGSVQLPARH